jgi:hypothetical protein
MVGGPPLIVKLLKELKEKELFLLKLKRRKVLSMLSKA